MEHKNQRIFFAVDTGYSQHVKDIQQRYGDMEVCLLPIAAYFHEEHGSWYRFVHITSEDALIAAKGIPFKNQLVLVI